MNPRPLTLTVRYFAVLREQSGLSSETVETTAATCGDLYAELQGRYGFTLAPSMVRAAVNRCVKGLDAPLSPGDEVVFIPPVAGG